MFLHTTRDIITPPGIGNAINEIFRALGRLFYIALRIVLIVLGISFVLMGALLILSLIMLLVFKYPVSISGSMIDMNLIYFSDFLKYIVNPVLVPWIIGLTLVIMIHPYDSPYILGCQDDLLVQGKGWDLQPCGIRCLDNAYCHPCGDSFQ